ncbi:MAG TPA: cysteine desulfurase family protein [Frankiaceae bacterium]|nr:cysteine desulfurase family protein [Frankiaceae bacterium]
MNRTVYLDANASTPLDQRVLDAMLPHFGAPGNASSSHDFGVRAARAVAEARERVAALLGCRTREIVFTSGATESNNVAIKGVAHGSDRRHLVTCATEHKAVLEPMRALARNEWSISVVGVNLHGVIGLDSLRDEVTSATALVSVMGANNETGTLAPLAAVADVAHAAGALFHCDGTQLVPWGPIDVEAVGVDLLSLSAHKMHGPQGVGALYVRREVAHRLMPLFDGGGQERGLRSGTLNVAGVVGLGAAADIVVAEAREYAPRVGRLRDELHREVVARCGAVLNGHPTERAPGTLNLCFGADVDAEAVTAGMPEVAVATGSACTSAVPSPSHVLTAMGIDAGRAHASLRLSLSRMTTQDDVRCAIDRISAVVAEVRERLSSGAVSA